MRDGRLPLSHRMFMRLNGTERHLNISLHRVQSLICETYQDYHEQHSIEPFVPLFIVAALTVPSLSAATPPSGRVAIINVHSGLCLSPSGEGRDLSGQIVQFTCDQDPSRFWSFTVVNGDIVEITTLNSGLCLTIAGGNTERNTASVQFTCDSDPSRRWHSSAVNANTFRLVRSQQPVSHGCRGRDR